MIQVTNISKRYSQILPSALNQISFDVKQGELFGLIGPDGAGKSTLFRILATLLLPDQGKININGWDVIKDYKNIRQNIGYMPGSFSLYTDLSVEENLNFFAGIFRTSVKENYDNIQPIYEQIAPFKKRRAGALSGGMKQKLALCCALVHHPSVLLLDEPTTGVDAVSRQEFWETLDSLRKGGMTILVSTPYMDEAILCDRVALIQAGNILDVNRPQSITKKFGQQLWAVNAKDNYRLLKDLRALKQTDTCWLFGATIHLTLKAPADITDIKNHLQEKEHDQLQIEPIQPGIEDTFMELMQPHKEHSSINH